jgi:hypothetical protein
MLVSVTAEVVPYISEEEYLAGEPRSLVEEYVVASQRQDAPLEYIFRRAEGWEPGERHTDMDAQFELRSVGLKLRVAELFAT